MNSIFVYGFWQLLGGWLDRGLVTFTRRFAFLGAAGEIPHRLVVARRDVGTVLLAVPAADLPEGLITRRPTAFRSAYGGSTSHLIGHSSPLPRSWRGPAL